MEGVNSTTMLLAVLIATVVWVAERQRREHARHHRERMVALLVTAVQPVVARADPRELLAWRGVAAALRALCPEAVTVIEDRTGARFPFAPDVVEGAHARWTAEWLAWERRHDAKYTQRTRVLEAELAAAGEGASPAGRARLAAVEDEKLQSYQQRYEEYVRIGKGLARLAEADDGRG